MDVSLHKRFYEGEPGEKFEKHCRRMFGTALTKAIRRRLADAMAATNLSDLTRQGFPGRWHWLTGDRKGQISADISKMDRLIFLPKEDMSEVEVDGRLHNERVTGLIVIEVADTHEG